MPASRITTRSQSHVDHIGWKLARKNVSIKKADIRFVSKVIVKLEILNDMHNENRSSICDKQWAKYRCESARVLSIESRDGNESFKSAISFHTDKRRPLTYNVGEVVRAHTWDKNIEKVCAGGIHYFLSREAAHRYNYIGGKVFGRHACGALTEETNTGRILKHVHG